MAAAGCRIGRVQAARAGADDEDFLFHGCRLDFRSVQFPANERVDRTAARGSRRPFSHAGETAQAVDDVCVPAFHDLLRRFGIGQQLPGHVDDVGFSRSDDVFHHGRVGQAADSGYGLADMFLDFSSQIDVTAVGFEHGRMGDAKGFLIRTGRYMDDIGIGFDGLGNLDAFFQAVSAFRKFSTAHAKFDGEKGADRGADRLQDFDGEADAVFQGAAVGVAAVIEQG